MKYTAPSTTPTRYRRLRRIVESVVSANEKANDFKPPQDSDLGDRAEQLKLHAICQLEQELCLTPNNKQTLLDRIRALFNAVDRIVHEEPSGSEIRTATLHGTPKCGQGTLRCALAKDHASAYAADKRGTLQSATSLLETSVSGMLEALESGCQLVSDSA